MKKLILSIAMIAFVAGTVSESYGQETMKTTKTEKTMVHQEKVGVTQIDSIADYQNLTKASEARFVENEKSIADLKLKNTTTDATEKTAKTKEIDLLEQQNNRLRNDLSSYKNDGKTEWKSFKKQFNADMDKLTEDLKKGVM